MNILSNHLLRAQEPFGPVCRVGPAPAQDSSRCHPGVNFGSCLDPSSMLSLQGGQRSTKAQRELNHEEQQDLRRKINSRERRRMQDLNTAMDALREVMVPYATSSSMVSTQPHQNRAAPGRRLSKISTLVLARNYILLLGSSLQEMRRLLGEIGVGASVTQAPRMLLAGEWPVISGPSQLFLSQEALLSSAVSPSPSLLAKYPLLSPDPGEASVTSFQWSSAGDTTGSLCPCTVCRLPRFNHSTPTSKFSK